MKWSISCGECAGRSHGRQPAEYFSLLFFHFFFIWTDQLLCCGLFIILLHLVSPFRSTFFYLLFRHSLCVYLFLPSAVDSLRPRRLATGDTQLVAICILKRAHQLFLLFTSINYYQLPSTWVEFDPMSTCWQLQLTVTTTSCRTPFLAEPHFRHSSQEANSRDGTWQLL